MKQFWLTYITIVGMTVIAFWVRSVKFSTLPESLNIKLTVVSFLVALTFWEALRFVDRKLDKYIPFEESWPKRIAVQLAVGVVIGLFIRTLIYRYGEPYFPLRLDELFLATTWAIYAFLPTSINLGFFTVHFINRWKASLVLAEKLEREKAQVQFDNLKNQLNPHFLFNALTSLNSLIFHDQALASEFLQQLAKVYRYVLQNKDKTMVSLETELSFIQHYVSLLHTRFKDSLNIQFEIPEESKGRAIVPVTLQVLIENALKHNIVDKSKPLTISVRVRDEYLEVSNNLQIRKLVEDSNKVGLDNLKTLYRYLSTKPLMVESDADVFTVKIPLL